MTKCPTCDQETPESEPSELARKIVQGVMDPHYVTFYQQANWVDKILPKQERCPPGHHCEKSLGKKPRPTTAFLPCGWCKSGQQHDRKKIADRTTGWPLWRCRKCGGNLVWGHRGYNPETPETEPSELAREIELLKECRARIEEVLSW